MTQENEPALPSNEEDRVAALKDLGLLDTIPEELFDRFTRVARRLFGVSIAVVSLIDSDRAWFLSSQGIEAKEVPRRFSFGAHAILGTGILFVQDASVDDRFKNNPFVIREPNVRFYAGCPIKSGTEFNIGSFCLMDSTPRTFSADEETLLLDLVGMVESELDAMHLASTDEVTRLANRRGFVQVGAHLLAMCKRTGRVAVLFSFHLEGLKEIQQMGAHAVNRALLLFAGTLVQTFRDSDLVAHISDGEFYVLGTAADDDEVPLNRLRDNIAAVIDAEKPAWPLNYKVGRVRLDVSRHKTIEDLLADARNVTV